MRKLYIIGDIDEDNYSVFTEAFDELETKSSEPIEIELYSQGGDAKVALAYAGRITNSHCKVHIKAYGTVESAAVLILAAGDKRAMSENGWVMVHEDEGEHSGDVMLMERKIKHSRALETQWTLLLERYTGTSAALWARLHKRTTYLTAKQAKQLKLVTEVF